MPSTPSLALPYLLPQQSQKHVTVNEALRRLDAIVQLTVKSRAETAQPGAPAEGEAYIIADGASGADWETLAARLIAVWQDGAWQAIAPREGFRAWIEDEAALAVFTDGDWEIASSGAVPDPLEVGALGVNTSPDAVNRLAVKSDAVLFHYDDVTPGSGDVRMICNKEAAGDTGSFLFQTNDSGRAEFGLIGNDDFTLKVSANGSSWTDALVVDTTGRSVFKIHAGVARTPPSDYWTTSANLQGFWWHYGYFGTNGGNAFGFYYNGYRSTSGWVSFGINGSNWAGGFEVGNSGDIRFLLENNPSGNSPTQALALSNTYLRPNPNNTLSLGDGSRRWTEVFATNGTINTSDADEKQIDGALDAAERAVARRLLSGVLKYRWRDSIARKGAGARTHIGFTAQRVHEAFAAEGLDASRYGLWCEDEVYEIALDEKGEEYERRTGRTIQGLRYDQLFAFLIAVIAEGALAR